jgi:hypothetical protein
LKKIISRFSFFAKSKRTVLLFISSGPEVIGDHGRNIRTGQHHRTQQTDSATACQQQHEKANRAIATSCSVTAQKQTNSARKYREKTYVANAG